MATIRSYTNPTAPSVTSALSRFKREVSTIPEVTSATEEVNRIRGNWDRGWSAFEGAVDTTRTAIRASNVERAKKAASVASLSTGGGGATSGGGVTGGGDATGGGGVPSADPESMRVNVPGYESDTSEVDVQEQATDKKKPAWSKALDFGKKALKTVGSAAVVAGATAVNPALGAAVVAGGGYKGLKRRRERQLQASIDKKREQFLPEAVKANMRASEHYGHDVTDEFGDQDKVFGWEQMLTDEERKYMGADKPSDTGEADSESFMSRFRDWSKETKQGFDEKASAKEQRKRDADKRYTDEYGYKARTRDAAMNKSRKAALKSLREGGIDERTEMDDTRIDAVKKIEKIREDTPSGPDIVEGAAEYEKTDAGEKYKRESESYQEIMDLRAFEEEHMTNASPEDKETYQRTLASLEGMVKSGDIDRTQLKNIMTTLPKLKNHIKHLKETSMPDLDYEQKQIFTDMYINAEIALQAKMTPRPGPISKGLGDNLHGGKMKSKLSHFRTNQKKYNIGKYTGS